ncbi:hypothetical protein WJX79_006354 [Trebouxia sp. C0005]
MARVHRLWLIAAAVALLALIVEMVGWGTPQILRAIREPAYAVQFCLIQSTDTDTGCVTVKYLHTPGGTADLFLYPDQSPQRQGTLAQREGYTGQYQIGFEYPCFYKAEALRQTDENLKKRIIALATKLENERDARMELDQRVSQALEVVSASRYQQSPLRRVSRVNAVQPFTRPTEDV